MKIKDLYNPVIGSQHIKGFISAVNQIQPFDSYWFNQLSIDEKVALDNIIKLKIGNRRVLDDFIEVSADVYKYISDVMRANNYQLDGLYRLLLKNDGDYEHGGYNPTDNVYEVRHETTDVDYDKGSKDTTYQYGKSTDTTKLSGSHKDTSEGKTTPFDAEDYSKATDKNTLERTYDNETTSTESLKENDKTVDGAQHDDTLTKYDVTRRGNIGITQNSELITNDRELHRYTFFNEVIRVLREEILNSFLWED